MDKTINILKAVLCITLTGSLLTVVWFLSGIYHSRTAPQPAEVVRTKTVEVPLAVSAQSARTLQDDFARIAEQSLPSVVVINTGRTVRRWQHSGIADQLHDYYYGTKEKVPTGQGSGFFVNEKGYILTNYHIIRGQEYFRVTLHDGKEFDALKITAKIQGIDFYGTCFTFRKGTYLTTVTISSLLTDSFDTISGCFTVK